VQRFREGFTRLPPMRSSAKSGTSTAARRELAREAGYVLAGDCAHTVSTFSFAPVLDLDYGASSVIGDRAFHADPHAVFQLGQAVMLGMKDAGMAACGKHFPGHGFVRADSHVAIPVDERTLADIAITDLVPFRLMIEAGLAAVMPAHVIYPLVDEQPAGSRTSGCKAAAPATGFRRHEFSATTVHGTASVAGGIVERVQASLAAAAIWPWSANRPDLADEVLASLKVDWPAPPAHGWPACTPPTPADPVQLRESARYVNALHHIAGLGQDSADLNLQVDPTDYCARS